MEHSLQKERKEKRQKEEGNKTEKWIAIYDGNHEGTNQKGREIKSEREKDKERKESIRV